MISSRTTVEYVSSEKFEKIAVEILMYPSLCFISKQLHSNTTLHNSRASDLNAVLEYLVQCELLFCIMRGVKCTRNSTCVYVKQLPTLNEDNEIDIDQRLIFGEKLKEFSVYHSKFIMDEY